MGCYGCRDATGIDNAETVIGFPYKDLDRIVRNLTALSERTIPRVRNKGVYQALLKRGDRGANCA